MKRKRIESEEEAQEWIDGPGGPLAILFWRTGEDELVARFDTLEWPRSWRVATIALDDAPVVAERMGVTETPAVAVLREGSILAVEYGCDPGACERVVRWARVQLRELHTA